jgi:hypothetical protein
MALEHAAHRETYQVTLADPGEDVLNTIQLLGYDVVIPLEKDADGDPLQDDRVRLVSDVGKRAWELTSSDEDAELDENSGMILYRFRDVPPGVYHVETFIRGAWYRVLEGLTVRQKGVFLGDTALGEDLPDSKFEAGDQEPDDDEPAAEVTLETLDWQDLGGEETP